MVPLSRTIWGLGCVVALMSASKVDPALKICSEQFVDVPPDFLAAYGSAIFPQKAERVREDRPNCAAGVSPLVDDLLQHTCVRVLRNEAEPNHFDALARHLFYNGGIVQEPPAAERQQVPELASVYTKLVLILAAQYADEEAIVREFHAQMLQGPQICLSDCVAREAYCRVHLVPYADH